MNPPSFSGNKTAHPQDNANYTFPRILSNATGRAVILELDKPSHDDDYKKMERNSLHREVGPGPDTLSLYRVLRDRLGVDERVALATVIARTGSGPREPGASMIVSEDGTTEGTVGGGWLEAKTLATASLVMREGHDVCLTLNLTSSDAAASGMICGGRVEILIECLYRADPLWTNLPDRVSSCKQSGSTCLLVRAIRSLNPADDSGETFLNRNPDKKATSRIYPVHVSRGLWVDGRLEESDGCPDHQNIDADLVRIDGQTEATLQTRNGIRFFLQPLRCLPVVIIVGAGHVGQALAHICPFVGFRTTVIDDRQDFANRDRFPEADDIRVPPSLEDCFQGLTVMKDSHIVIVTRGHASDRAVLAQSLRTEAPYIGMIASKTKRNLIYESLLSEGFRPDDLARVHSPIGLAIGAKTPAEIAISIVAELIAFRAGKTEDKPVPKGTGT